MELDKLKSAIKASKLNEKVHWKDFCTQTAIRGMIIGMAMAWFLQLTGRQYFLSLFLFSSLSFFLSFAFSPFPPFALFLFLFFSKKIARKNEFNFIAGCFIFINYAMLVFKKSDGIIDPHISSIVLAVVQIIGGLLSTSLSDKLPRKVLLIISLVGSAVGLFSLSIYLYLDHIGFDLSSYSSVPIVCLSFVIFISCAGIAPLSNVCTVENLPPKVCK